ncbi:hypothetical protein PsorP6_007357 [Peronosclerospora sorghi]|uniref:Uncharacterized protein n=1 Tax=Peronosclerospora sorghi TaxID=230839 RepID=A0ACC0W6A1_9STRA|nr:hypothetical protein PsorP6_007357 [Peronosclerospora sorghi]
MDTNNRGALWTGYGTYAPSGLVVPDLSDAGTCLYKAPSPTASKPLVEISMASAVAASSTTLRLPSAEKKRTN